MADRGRSSDGSAENKPPPMRAFLHKAVPSHFKDPFGLAIRILKSRNADAWSAVLQAAARLGLLPVDVLMSLMVGATAKADIAPSQPVLFVTGPPRSGTTLLHQILIRSLPVAYITNLACQFPRSAVKGAWPLTAAIANSGVRLESYYGRTRSLSGPSDGLEFWDRWFGPGRRAIPDHLPSAAAAEMRQFFACLERASGNGVVAKNNNLLGSAHLVADAMPTAKFVCLRRDPLYLAQSLLKARLDINGSIDESYGMGDRTDGSTLHRDAVSDVWKQVDFYDETAARQVERLGKDRFRIVGYEELCADPAAVVSEIAREVFGLNASTAELQPLQPSKKISVDKDLFERLVKSGRR